MKFHKAINNGWKIYNNYEKSMGRRRPDSILPGNNFDNYCDRQDVFGYFEGCEPKLSAVIGQIDSADIDGESFEIFKASHFAPASPREGVKLLKKMAKEKNQVIVFTVTPDLVDMLIGCGFSPVGISFQMFWNGEENTKHIFTQFGNETLVKSFVKEKDLI